MLPLIFAIVAFTSQDLADQASAVAHHPTAAGYRALAAAYEAAGEYTPASVAFQEAADRYAKLGDLNAAKVLHEQSMRYRTDLQMFIEQPNEAAQPWGAARLEPGYGCYVGANIEREDGPRDPGEFNDRIGKNHAIYFIYRKYGLPFPSDYARQLRRLKAGLQIAWEPSNLDEVQDDSFLEDFASKVAQSGIPVFLRFASEMNGDWTPYHNDPVAYTNKFRLVAAVMHRTAPNAAMVWCPNEIPEMTIPSYFPGDEAVDWVGVNFYSVLFNDGNRDRAADWRNPADALQFIYQTYSAKHPIMIGEWAATHMSVVDHLDRTDFAIDKIGQLYAALPRLYPRVKSVNWLSMNTEKYAEGERKLNDFCLMDDRDVEDAYSKAIAPEYYLSEAVIDGDPPSPETRIDTLEKNAVLSGNAVISAVARSYEQHPHVSYTLGDTRTYDAGTATGPYEIHVDTHMFPNGPLKIVIQARDHRNRLAGSRTITVTVRN
jgi:hypothetical protein